jgi:hypothetical protein
MAKIKGTGVVKTGSRLQRGGSVTSSDRDNRGGSGIDRAQLGVGSGAVVDGIDNLQSSNTQGFDKMSGQLGDLNGSIGDMNENMLALKKLEQLQLLFEVAQWTKMAKADLKANEEFGQIFKKMDKIFAKMDKSMQANSDEGIARNEAGFRAIVKSVARLHSFFAGDTKEQRAIRMEANSVDQNESLMKHRSIRDAQRKVFKKHGIYKITDDSDSEIKADFWRASDNAAGDHKRRRDTAKENAWQAIAANDGEIDKARAINNEAIEDRIASGKQSHVRAQLTRARMHMFNRAGLNDANFGGGFGGPAGPGGIGGGNIDAETTQMINRRVKQLTAEALDLTMNISKDGKNKMQGKGKVKRFLTQEEFLKAMEDPKVREALMGKDMADEWATGKTNMHYNAASGSLMADRPKKGSRPSKGGDVIPILSEIRDCVCATYKLFAKGGGSIGLASREKAEEAENQERNAKIKARTKGDGTPAKMTGLGAAAGIAAMGAGISSLSSYGAGGDMIPMKGNKGKNKNVKKETVKKRIQRLTTKYGGQLGKFMAKRIAALGLISVIPGIGQAVTIGMLAWMAYDIMDILDEFEKEAAAAEAAGNNAWDGTPSEALTDATPKLTARERNTVMRNNQNLARQNSGKDTGPWYENLFSGEGNGTGGNYGHANRNKNKNLNGSSLVNTVETRDTVTGTVDADGTGSGVAVDASTNSNIGNSTTVYNYGSFDPSRMSTDDLSIKVPTEGWNTPGN